MTGLLLFYSVARGTCLQYICVLLMLIVTYVDSRGCLADWSFTSVHGLR
jgi:hypothetical protein